MSDYNEYMRDYRAKNRDRINARQRERRKGSNPKKIKPVIKEINFGEELGTRTGEAGEQKCCSCHLPGKHYTRNRWFCDAHRP